LGRACGGDAWHQRAQNQQPTTQKTQHVLGSTMCTVSEIVNNQGVTANDYIVTSFRRDRLNIVSQTYPRALAVVLLGFTQETVMSKRWLLTGVPKAEYPAPMAEHLKMDDEKQEMFWKRQEKKHATSIRLAKGRSFKRHSLTLVGTIARAVPPKSKLEASAHVRGGGGGRVDEEPTSPTGRDYRGN
jgi:hypothetical protein